MKNLKKLRNYLNLTQDKLAEKINIDKDLISKYENEISNPSFQILLKFTDFFRISFDYLVLDEKCLYPRNIKLLKLAKKIDDLHDPNIRSNIETSTTAFLNNIKNKQIDIKQDQLEIKLTDDFHSNLKNIRKYKNIRQIDCAKDLNISAPLLGMYEKRIYPSIEKFIKISKRLNISMHALATGEKLFFDFQDRPFGKTMLLADQLLPLEEHKMLIHLMEAIIKHP